VETEETEASEAPAPTRMPRMADPGAKVDREAPAERVSPLPAKFKVKVVTGARAVRAGTVVRLASQCGAPLAQVRTGMATRVAVAVRGVRPAQGLRQVTLAKVAAAGMAATLNKIPPRKGRTQVWQGREEPEAREGSALLTGGAAPVAQAETVERGPYLRWSVLAHWPSGGWPLSDLAMSARGGMAVRAAMQIPPAARPAPREGMERMGLNIEAHVWPVSSMDAL